MTTTTFDSPFDNSSEGFTEGERVRVITGKHAGRFAEITTVLTHGFYDVKIEGTDDHGVFDYHEIEPLIEPVTYSVFPEPPPYGMTSAQLAEEVSEAITRATSRIVGVGKDQYDQGSAQQFEDMDLFELLEYALEELDDSINYAVMTQIRIRRIRAGLKAKM